MTCYHSCSTVPPTLLYRLIFPFHQVREAFESCTNSLPQWNKENNRKGSTDTEISETRDSTQHQSIRDRHSMKMGVKFSSEDPLYRELWVLYNSMFEKESLISTTMKKHWGIGNSKRSYYIRFTEVIFRGLTGRDEDQTETRSQIIDFQWHVRDTVIGKGMK